MMKADDKKRSARLKRLEKMMNCPVRGPKMRAIISRTYRAKKQKDMK